MFFFMNDMRPRDAARAYHEWLRAITTTGDRRVTGLVGVAVAVVDPGTHGRGARASNKTIAGRIGKSLRQVERDVALLVRLGWLRRDGYHKNAPGVFTAVYSIA